MASIKNKLLILTENPKDVFDETVRLLVKIADNILKDPSNLKIRTLQKSNSTITNKILKVSGGTDCLRLMGFQENADNFNLPIEAPLNRLDLVKSEIERLKLEERKEKAVEQSTGAISKNVQVEENNVKEETFKRIVLPPYTSICTNLFLKEVESHFHNVMIYENSYLQQRALSALPLGKLEMKAQEKLRSYQEYIKKAKLESPEVNLHDMLILELLSWFKNDFFEWVDSPDCKKCGGKTRMSHMSKDPELLIYTNRVEMHICDSCQTLTPFPRYNDLNILLETRKGRCGEWANVFTLFCRALKWDSRYVVDQTDHVWTEIYSHSRKRWLHCDPCENVCDTPLMYESGWGKSLSYIIAYSSEEVQDVTWRYTSKHKEVLKARNQCGEQELISTLINLRENRQKSLSKSRKDYLTKRTLFELLELMVERRPTAKDSQGRTSGSLAWRLSRGESQATNFIPYIWKLTESNVITIRYSASEDIYQELHNSEILREVKGWQNGIYSQDSFFRKVEKDWKVVYLSRMEGSSNGMIAWRFECDNQVIDRFEISFEHKLFETGTIQVKICDNNKCIIADIRNGQVSVNDFSGSSGVTISAILSGGKGDVAWQHAQLFRQPLDCNKFPFEIKFYLKKN